jgi:hypothetical protein
MGNWVIGLLVLVLAGSAGIGRMDAARVVAGETPGCAWPAKVAAAQVMLNREAAGMDGGWYGDAEPGPLDVLAVLWAPVLPDLVGGAVFFIGPGDAPKLEPWLGDRTGRWVCPGTWVESWRRR